MVPKTEPFAPCGWIFTPPPSGIQILHDLGASCIRYALLLKRQIAEQKMIKHLLSELTQHLLIISRADVNGVGASNEFEEVLSFAIDHLF